MRSPPIPDKGTRSLRLGRYSERNRIYHITSCKRSDAVPFDSLQTGRIVVRSLHMQPQHAKTLAYAVMPDHLHWLMQLVGHRDLGACVNTMKSASARQICRVVGKGGGVWQKGYYDRAIREEEDLQAVARYVVANPLRAGLVATLRDYPHWDAVWL